MGHLAQAAVLGDIRETDDLIRRLTEIVRAIKSSRTKMRLRGPTEIPSDANVLFALGLCLADEAPARPATIRAALREIVRLRVAAHDWDFLPVIAAGPYGKYLREPPG